MRSNVALCVNPKFKYVKVKDPATQNVYIVAESRLSALPGAVATAGAYTHTCTHRDSTDPPPTTPPLSLSRNSLHTEGLRASLWLTNGAHPTSAWSMGASSKACCGPSPEKELPP